MIGRIVRTRGRMGDAWRARQNERRLWGAAGSGLLPPPRRAFGAFGATSLIVPPSRVQAPEHIRIGERVQVGEGTWLCVVPVPGRPAPRLVIGDGTTVSRFVKIVCAGEVVIGDDCGISDHTFIADTYYRYDDPDLPILRQPLAEPRPVVIGSRVFLGFRAIIKPGVTIGDNAYVGAGSVVTEDVPARTVVVGDPARAVRRYDDATRSWVAVKQRRPTQRAD
jgi:acetyltransferase-like isoleucine patch superfamily enzyme